MHCIPSTDLEEIVNYNYLKLIQSDYLLHGNVILYRSRGPGLDSRLRSGNFPRYLSTERFSGLCTLLNTGQGRPSNYVRIPIFGPYKFEHTYTTIKGVIKGS